MSEFKWPLINNNISQEDKQILADFILNNNRFTNGPKVREFEAAWSEWLGTKYSVMVGSGASANYITTSIVREMKGQGGEIIVPPIGWVSDISSVINTGFVPCFVDVDLESMAITYENIKNAINENTKAIVLVHALGFDGLTQELIDLAEEHDLLLIEDCCEAHGATHSGKRVGTYGHMSCFSFYFGHHITTIEGGIISTDSEEIYELARMFRSHGMTREASLKTQERYIQEDLNPLFTFAVPGYNMRSTELNAVLGLNQLKRLDSNVQSRANNLQIWLDNLDKSKYFTNFKTEGNSSFALPLFIIDETINLKDICNILEQECVEYRIGTAGGGNQARQPYLKNYNFKIVGELKNSNFIHDNALYIGNHTELEADMIKELCNRLNNV